jgi:octaprenyl-diphosphate synthase
VDESMLRRGESTANAVWGNAPSVLVGDFLLGKAFQMLALDGSIDVLRVLSDTSAIITEGEVKQLMQVSDVTTTRETYLDIIESKTAALFVAACEVGAMVADRNEQERAALRDFGRYLGVAFQIVDDALDYAASQESLGKTVGDDFREKKVTLPLILAYEQGNAEDREFWRRVIKHDQTDTDLHHAIALMGKGNILKQTFEVAQSYAQRGAECLDVFADGQEKQALIELLEFSVNRPY